LIDRIRRMMGVHFGDLHVRRGLTMHEPTGEVFLHSVGVSLVLGAALGQEVVLQDTEAKAAKTDAGLAGAGRLAGPARGPWTALLRTAPRRRLRVHSWVR
jgi:hypothetical protein